MMGLIVIVAFGLYALISVGVVQWAVRHARKTGKSPRRWGWGAALVMYLIPFWDWIPTVVMHKYYCEKEAGFWVYKTPEQWKKENPGVMETLVANKGKALRVEPFDGGHANADVYVLNSRFEWIVAKRDISNLLPLIRSEQQVKDARAKEVLARYIDFGSGNSVKDTVGPPGPLKFWLRSYQCPGGGSNQDAMRDFRNHFLGAKQ